MALAESPDATPPLVLLTGAAGFLGRRLVRAWLDRGWPPARLRCVVRNRERALAAGLPEASLCLVDLADATSERALATAADGVDVVLHLAAELKGWSRSAFDFNVVASERLWRATADAAPSAHVVLVSSLAAAGPSIDGTGSDALPDRCRPVSAYGESKRRSEALLVAGGRPWTIVRPPVVYGPGDAATQLLFRQALAPFAVVPWAPRPLSVVHVDDVARALALAVERRPAGAVLPLDGPERTDTHAFVRAMAAACGRRTRLLPVPIAVAALGAFGNDAVAALRRRASLFNRDKVREIRAPGWVADPRPARERLGFTARVALAEGLAAAARADGFARAT